MLLLWQESSLRPLVCLVERFMKRVKIAGASANSAASTGGDIVSKETAFLETHIVRKHNMHVSISASYLVGLGPIRERKQLETANS